MLQGGRQERIVEIDDIGIIGAHQRGEDRQQRQQQDEEQPGHGQMVPAKGRDRIAQQARRADLLERDRFCQRCRGQAQFLALPKWERTRGSRME